MERDLESLKLPLSANLLPSVSHSCCHHTPPGIVIGASVSSAVARSGDGLAQQVFREAGEMLGAHVKALVPQAEGPLLRGSGGLHVVAVGSVLINCWDLLKEGIIYVSQ